jgi:hypothetical protein
VIDDDVHALPVRGSQHGLGEAAGPGLDDGVIDELPRTSVGKVRRFRIAP